MEEKPVVYRKFQKTSLQNNNNKEWHVLLYADGRIITRNGRVGGTLAEHDRGTGTRLTVQGLCNEKLNKGYHELIMADHELMEKQRKKLPATASTDPVENLAADILHDANEGIRQYLDVPLDTLSEMHIGIARNRLNECAKLYADGRLPTLDNKMNWINIFYSMIPTILPRQPVVEEVVSEFYGNLDKQYQRLDQLESAVKAAQVQNVGGSALAQLGEVQMVKMDHADPRYAVALQSVHDTGGYPGIVEDIYLVRLPKERAAFEAETKGKDNVKIMFHGTDSSRIASILRTGLYVPSSYINGWRLGPGIYFADKFQRSASYTRGNKRKLMLMVQVALGKSYPTTSELHVKEPPTGYDSVWGQKTFSGLGDEWVVYRTSQQSVVSILVLKQ